MLDELNLGFEQMSQYDRMRIEFEKVSLESDKRETEYMELMERFEDLVDDFVIFAQSGTVGDAVSGVSDDAKIEETIRAKHNKDAPKPKRQRPPEIGAIGGDIRLRHATNEENKNLEVSLHISKSSFDKSSTLNRSGNVTAPGGKTTKLTPSKKSITGKISDVSSKKSGSKLRISKGKFDTGESGSLTRDEF